MNILKVVDFLSDFLHDNNELAAHYKTMHEQLKEEYGSLDKNSLPEVIMRIWSKKDILKNVSV